ncbi:hypothetical protein DMUE_1733 [Dictyocoela muelleri]|nr:hypothetical protein DMUE_1733 [Dictyocoela muelleri]
MVPDRSASSLIPIIKKVVRTSSVIHKDMWKAYNTLNSRQNYSHSKITHKYNFVDPESGIHTKNVESFNNKIKTEIKSQKGVRINDRAEFLEIFIFIDTLKENVFAEMLNLLKVF